MPDIVGYPAEVSKADADQLSLYREILSKGIEFRRSARQATWKRSDIPTGISGINNISDFGKFAASTLGQTAPQLVLTIGTLGTGTPVIKNLASLTL